MTWLRQLNNTPANTIALSPNGDALALLDDHRLHVVTPSGAWQAALPDGLSLACTTDRLYATDRGGAVTAWRLGSGERLARFQHHASSTLPRRAALPNGELVIARSGRFDVVDGLTGTVRRTIDARAPMMHYRNGAVIDPDGTHLVVVGGGPVDNGWGEVHTLLEDTPPVMINSGYTLEAVAVASGGQIVAEIDDYLGLHAFQRTIPDSGRDLWACGSSVVYVLQDSGVMRLSPSLPDHAWQLPGARGLTASEDGRWVAVVQGGCARLAAWPGPLWEPRPGSVGA